MESAIDVLAGRRVPASHGRQGRTYECARCRAQVHLRAGQYRAAHFAHNPGVGDPECELFADSVSTNSPQPAYEIRTSPLQLCIAEDGSWQLYVEIPPIEPGEWGLAQLSRFAGSFVTINGDAGSKSATRSARELWPGSGRNAVTVVPTTARSSFRTNSAWPDRVERRRWHRELPPVSAGGTLFARYRGGNFRKYDPQTTPLHWGDTVILVSAGSKKFVSGPRIRRLETRHTEAADWYAWEGSLPARQNARVRDWLAGLGASVEARNARPKLVSVPTGYAADDVPRYPAGAVVAVDAGASWCEIHLHHRNRPYTAEQLGGPGMTGLRSDRPIDSVMVKAGFGRHVEYQVGGASRVTAYGWSVRCGERNVYPFESLSMEMEPQVLEFDTAPNVDGPFFDIELDNGREVLRVMSVEPADAQMWIRERMSQARHIRIDAGNLGSVEIFIESGKCTPAPDSSPSQQGKHGEGWFKAHALAAGTEGQQYFPHWRCREVLAGDGRAVWLGNLRR